MSTKSRIDALEKGQGTNLIKPPPLKTKMDPKEYLEIVTNTVTRMEANGFDPNHKTPINGLTDGEFIVLARAYIIECKID